jgi:ABC-type transporter Mla MlaB component
MLNYSIDQENHIIEVTISGKITKDELTKMIGEIESPLKEWNEVRILKRIDSFGGMEFAAIADDLKFAYNNFNHLKKMKKVAVVTDTEWIEKISGFFSSFFPGEVKLFEQEDIEKARTWLK